MRGFAIAAGCAVGLVFAGCSAGPSDDASDYELVGGSGPSRTSPGEPSTPEESSTEGAGGTTQTTGGSAEQSPPGDGGTPSAPPRPTKITMRVEGTSLTVGTTLLGVAGTGPVTYDIVVKVTGPGVATGSELHVVADHLGRGCLATANFMSYRPSGELQYVPKAGDTCGLIIDELPKAVGGRFRGHYLGFVTQIGTSTKTKLIDLELDVLRDK